MYNTFRLIYLEGKKSSKNTAAWKGWGIAGVPYYSMQGYVSSFRLDFTRFRSRSSLIPAAHTFTTSVLSLQFTGVGRLNGAWRSIRPPPHVLLGSLDQPAYVEEVGHILVCQTSESRLNVVFCAQGEPESGE